MWDGVLREKSAVRSLTRFDPSIFRSHNAAEVPDFDPNDFIESKRARRLDRFGQFSVAAAKQAIEDSELDLAVEDRERVGAMMGTALGGVGYAEEQLSLFLREGLRAVDATLALAVFGGAASCNIAIELGVSGPNSTNAMSCASGAMAIGEAFRQVRDGYADVMIAGGAEAPLAPLCYGAFALIRAMSTRNDDPQHASRPFDVDRDGFVMGEGAGCLLLEEYEHARARGARIYGELAGAAMTADAYHMTGTHPEGAGALRAMQDALEDAGIGKDAVDYLNVHATSTPVGDLSETKAVSRLFGEAPSGLVISATKSMTGHLLGAAGAIEAIVCLMAIRDGVIPPTINTKNLDPAIPKGLNILLGEALQRPVNVAMSNTFGFGGHNGIVIFKKV